MNKRYLRDERGVAMLLELVLVAAVLSLVGLAVYQANHNTGSVATEAKVEKAASVESLAASASKIVEADSNDDVSLSADAEGSGDELGASDEDANKLEGSSNDNF